MACSLFPLKKQEHFTLRFGVCRPKMGGPSIFSPPQAEIIRLHSLFVVRAYENGRLSAFESAARLKSRAAAVI